MKAQEGKMTFEDAMRKLEKIVSDLESGETALEKSIQRFEEGMELVRFCSRKLNEIEKKVEMITKQKDGRVTRKPFDESSSDKTSAEPEGKEKNEDDSDDDDGEELLF